MITNLPDLGRLLSWLADKGFEPAKASEYPHHVEYGGYAIAAAGDTIEWRVLAITPLGYHGHSSPFNMDYHLQVAPWVIDDIHKYQDEIKRGIR